MKLFQLYPKALAHLTCKSPKVSVVSGEIFLEKTSSEAGGEYKKHDAESLPNDRSLRWRILL